MLSHFDVRVLANASLSFCHFLPVAAAAKALAAAGIEP
jgi:hypothetical protein